uniref:Uncharacterized protein n=1 Tax=Pristionchus pacificus TaxID=54126 RepID=A0A8R1Z3U3_PRIPA
MAAEKFGPIFAAIQKKNEEGYETGNVALAIEFYDAHAVSVDLLNNKHYYGLEEIKPMVDAFIKLGTSEFKTPRKVFHEIGNDRFLVDLDFETTLAATGRKGRRSSSRVPSTNSSTRRATSGSACTKASKCSELSRICRK